MYTIACGNDFLLDPVNDENVYDITAGGEVNASPYLKFSIAPTHPCYEKINEDAIRNPDLTVELKFDELVLFRGFISEIQENFDRTLDVECTGEIAYLNNVLLRPYTTGTGTGQAPRTVDGYFKWLIQQYNAYSKGNLFQVGLNQGSQISQYNVINIDSSDYPSVADALSSNIINNLGGYVYSSYDKGEHTVNLISDAADVNNQVIDFGVNLLDYTKTLNDDDLYTACMPYNDSIDLKDYTISVNDGADGFILEDGVLYDKEAVNKYGYIEERWQCSDVDSQSEMIKATIVHLKRYRSIKPTIEIKAVDLALFMDGYSHLYPGQLVRVRSLPHELDRYLLVNSMDLDISNPDNTSYTLGIPYSSLTGEESSKVRELDDSISDIDSNVGAIGSATTNIGITTKSETGYIESVAGIGIVNQATQYVNDLVTGTLTADLLIADHAVVNNLDVNYAHITNGVIDNAKIGYADVDQLEVNYAKIDLANVNNAWINNGVIKDAAIGDAQIIGVSANKLTAGEIDASKIMVTNLNATNITAGKLTVGGLTIDVTQSKTEIDAGTAIKDGTIKMEGLSTEVQDAIDGAIETYTVTEVPTLNNTPAVNWITDKDKEKHVGDVAYVVNSAESTNGYCYRFTMSSEKVFSWVLIKDSDVTAALQRLVTAEGKIEGLETFETTISSWKTDTDKELSSLKTSTTSLTTRVGDAETAITTKVDTSTFNEVKQTVDENSASITSLNETVESKADSSTVTTLSNTVNNVKQTADENSSAIKTLTTTTDNLGTRMTTAETSIKQNSDDITLRATKTDAQSYADTAEENAKEYTISQGYLTASSTEITSRVTEEQLTEKGYQNKEAVQQITKDMINSIVMDDTSGSTIEQTSTGWKITIEDKTARDDASEAKTSAAQAAIDAGSAISIAEDAKKTATDYLSFENDTLTIGKTGYGSTAIKPQEIDFLDSNSSAVAYIKQEYANNVLDVTRFYAPKLMLSSVPSQVTGSTHGIYIGSNSVISFNDGNYSGRVKDWITSEGISSSWYVRYWASGYVDMWKIVTISLAANTWASGTWTYPLTLSNPVLNVSAYITNVAVAPQIGYSYAGSSSCEIYFLSEYAGSGGAYIHIHGKK